MRLAFPLCETKDVISSPPLEPPPPFSYCSQNRSDHKVTLQVVKYVGSNRFAPNDTLTRKRAATMISRFANAIGKPFTQQSTTFNDNDTVASGAIDVVGQMQATGKNGGVGNNTYAPKSDYSRAHSIITMFRLYYIVK